MSENFKDLQEEEIIDEFNDRFNIFLNNFNKRIKLVENK